MEKVVSLCHAPRLHLPLGRDLRRLPLHLRLRPARGQHAAQRQGRLVALHGPAARRRGRPRRGHPRPARGLGGLGPPGHLHRPAGRLPQLQRALARRQDRRGLPQLRLERPHRGPRLQPDVQDACRPGRGRGPRRLPAPRDRPGHVHQLRQRARHDAQEAARSASPRSASRSATRSRRRTSSSAPASSSRWRWSTSSRPPRADSGSSTGSSERMPLVPRPRHPGRRLRLRHHDPDELSHYSRGTADVEFLFPWGWDELEGIANRGDYDLGPTPRPRGSRSTTSTRRPTSATRPT